MENSQESVNRTTLPSSSNGDGNGNGVPSAAADEDVGVAVNGTNGHVEMVAQES